MESAPSYTDAAGETSERSSLGHEMQAVCRNHIELTPDVAASTASFNMVFVAVIVALTDPVNQVILPVRGKLLLVPSPAQATPVHFSTLPFRYFNHYD